MPPAQHAVAAYNNLLMKELIGSMEQLAMRGVAKLDLCGPCLYGYRFTVERVSIARPPWRVRVGPCSDARASSSTLEAEPRSSDRRGRARGVESSN